MNLMTVNKNNPGSKGFTLIELLITIAIVSVITSLGTPTFSAIIKNNRLSTNANDLLASINLARSEAIKRSTRVFVSRKGGTDSDWSDGWDIYISADGSGRYNSVEDTLIKTYSELKNNFTLKTGGNYVDWLAFLPTGLPVSSDGTGNDTFNLCDNTGNGGAENARRIMINIVGRARVVSGGATCS